MTIFPTEILGKEENYAQTLYLLQIGRENGRRRPTTSGTAVVDSSTHEHEHVSHIVVLVLRMFSTEQAQGVDSTDTLILHCTNYTQQQ